MSRIFFLNASGKYDPLETRLYEAFSMENVLEYHRAIYDKEKRDYTLGICYACGSYALVINYETNGYPNFCECLACNFSQKDILGEEYRECPECSINALVYSENLDGGICLNYRCANNRDGGVLTPMEMCYFCGEYKIEDICNCIETETLA